MRPIIVIIWITTICFNSSAQVALVNNFPKVAMKIKLFNNSFPSSDSVKFLITLTNNSDSNQKLLFDKPLEKIYPWGTTAIVKDHTGASMIKISGRELISSQLYTEDQLEKKKFYYVLKPGQSVSHAYYLSDIPIFNTPDGKLPQGRYTLQLSYYINQSNRVFFIIK